MKNTFDVAVVGAGVMGASTALFLGRAGMQVALVDRAGICSEASGGNAGTLTMNMTRAALIPYALKGWQMWINSRQWLGADPGVTAADGLSLAFTEEEADMLTHRAQARRDMGAEINLIDGKQAQEIEPGLCDKVLLAAHCPIDGHVTANFTGKIFRQALLNAGVSFFENHNVLSIDPEHKQYLIHTGSSRITAKRVVLAGGVWLESMLGWLGVKLRIKTLANQLIITERTPPVMRSVVSVANGLLSLKQFANGTVLIGGGWQGRANRDTGETSVITDNVIGNVQLARYVIPALAQTRVVRTWVGFEAETDDAMPLIGALPGMQNAYIIGSVHSGYTSGPYMGKLLADLIQGREPEMPLFEIQRLQSSDSQTPTP